MKQLRRQTRAARFAGLRPTPFAAAWMTIVVAALSCTGCKSGDGFKFAELNPKRVFSRTEEKPEPQIPARLITSWSNTVLTRPGQPAKRGFGGRLIFQGPASEEPIRVDGQLVVYAYDDTDRPAYETQPSRRYIFPADQLVHYESDSKLGPSYSVWLPWDEVGGPEKKISLIARFEPKGGPVVVGEQTKHFLPGPVAPVATSPGQPTPVPRTNNVQLASFEASPISNAVALQTPNSGQVEALQTTTIRLPRGLSNGAPLPSVGAQPVQQNRTNARTPAINPSSQTELTPASPVVNAPAASLFGAPAWPQDPLSNVQRPWPGQPLANSPPAIPPAPRVPVVQ
jgi:hypothetical protein